MAAHNATSLKSDPRTTPDGAPPPVDRTTRRPHNPLRDSMALGKMPIIQELHLTERDRVAYQQLRQRYLADTAALPDLTFLGQYLRQLDVTSGDLTTEERSLTRKLQVYADLLSSGKIDLIAGKTSEIAVRMSATDVKTSGTGGIPPVIGKGMVYAEGETVAAGVQVMDTSMEAVEGEGSLSIETSYG